jgi:UDP-N-acetylglucosamine 2-epimerase
MSQVFFDELGIPRPAANLEVGSGPHGRQTGAMLERIEELLLDDRPDWVLVYGDTNSTLAGALAAAKLHVPVAHVEAGLRSFNRRMPEEINRVLADHVSSLLLCPTRTAVAHLANEGITANVHNVGDVMYDSVLFNAELAKRTSTILSRLALKPKSFYLATIHRAENTDDPARLAGIVQALRRLDRPVVLPLHPRTHKTLGARLDGGCPPCSPAGEERGPIRVIDPLPYLDMLMLESASRLILTDSGGVQKEAYWFGVPCVTLREETEWVELVESGCSRLAGADPAAIAAAVSAFESADCTLPAGRPADLYGDGHAAERIVQLLSRGVMGD